MTVNYKWCFGSVRCIAEIHKFNINASVKKRKQRTQEPCYLLKDNFLQIIITIVKKYLILLLFFVKCFNKDFKFLLDLSNFLCREKQFWLTKSETVKEMSTL